MSTQFFQKAAASFPVAMRLATIRCTIYAAVVGANAFQAGVEGYDALSDMTPLQKAKLALNILIAVLGVWIAFLDQTLQSVKQQPGNNAPPAPISNGPQTSGPGSRS